jgi:hypothetical protein
VFLSCRREKLRDAQNLAALRPDGPRARIGIDRLAPNIKNNKKNGSLSQTVTY